MATFAITTETYILIMNTIANNATYTLEATEAVGDKVSMNNR